jgi:hypothetical protein
VRVNQCNGTGNPGGTVMTCRTTITTNITAAAAASPTATSTPVPVPTAAPIAVPVATTVPGTTTGAGGPPQVSRVPSGGVQAGAGSTAGVEDRGLLQLGAVLIFAAALIGVRRRRFTLAVAARCRD